MSAPDLFAGGDAQILDRGYRTYEGSRTGVRGAMWAVTRHSIQRALGMRRTLWAKLLPIFAAGIAYVPAVVFVGIVALFKQAQDITQYALPTYAAYYGFIIAALVVFAAIVAPEVLCTDRRSGMLGVYLASPLNRDTYLVAKAAAIGFVLSIACLGPPLLMLIANVLQSQGPKGADIPLTLVRILASGLAITLMYTGTTMGVASLTDRKAIATAGVLLVILVSIMVAGTLSSVGGDNAIAALAPTLLTVELAARVHGEYSQVAPGASSLVIWLAWAGWTIGGFALARIQLHRLPVTR